MDNQQFRRLLIDSPNQQGASAGSSQSPPSRTPGAVLGARKTASIPMTPRQVGRNNSIQADFARQLAERNAKKNPQKKFKSVAPKGSKLAAGYIDRTKERRDDEDDERAKRIKNLEDAMKLGHIDRETFEKLSQEIAGGDISATHLVKGLDRKLLERVRKGEDVYGNVIPHKEQGKEEDIEGALDELAERDVGSVLREKVEKKGEVAPPKPVAGVKRSRNDILAELRRQREEAAAAAAAEHEKKYPTLGKGFRKVTDKRETSRIEVDKQGREVLIITDAQGKEKRKVRKQKQEDPPPEVRHDLDDEKKPLNNHNLPPPLEKEESEDEDIFEGVGSNYNPLANLNSDEESSEEEAEVEDVAPAADTADTADTTDIADTADTAIPRDQLRESGTSDKQASDHTSKPTTATAGDPPRKRDYFSATSRTFAPKDTTQPSESSTADATVRAVLQKVRTLDPNSTLLNDPDSEESRLKKRAAELAARDRDMEDIDMGFGGSRFDDAEEMEQEGEKVKFSEWKGLGGEDNEEEEAGRAGKKRKRGPKKRKGDKNSAADVLKAMERQKEKTLG